MSYYNVVKLNQEYQFNNAYDAHSVPEFYQVTTDNLNATEVDVLRDSSGLPANRSLRTGTTDVRVANRTGSRKLIELQDGSTGALWTISINYEKALPGTSGERDEVTGSNSRLVSFRIDFNTIEKALEKAYKAGDSLGNPTDPIINSAGQLFDPPVKDYKYNMVIAWTQVESAYFSLSSIRGYIGTVNRNAVTICGITVASGKGCMRKISPVLKVNDSGSYYFEVSYEVEVDEEGFAISLRSRGFRQKDINGKLKDILKGDLNSLLAENNPDEAAQKIEEPADLNSGGYITTTPYYMTYDPKCMRSWNGLNFISRIK